MRAEMLVDLATRSDLLFLAGVVEQEFDLTGAGTDAVDRPGVKNRYIGQQVLLRCVVDARRIGGVDPLRIGRHAGGVGPRQDRGPVDAPRLAGEDIIVPGMGGDFEQIGMAVLGIPN